MLSLKPLLSLMVLPAVARLPMGQDDRHARRFCIGGQVVKLSSVSLAGNEIGSFFGDH